MSVEWNAKGWGDLVLKPVSSETGSGGGRQSYVPWKFKEEESAEAAETAPAARLELTDRVTLSPSLLDNPLFAHAADAGDVHTPGASVLVRYLPAQARLLCLDLNLHWLSWLAASTGLRTSTRGRAGVQEARRRFEHGRRSRFRGPVPVTPYDSVVGDVMGREEAG